MVRFRSLGNFIYPNLVKVLDSKFKGCEFKTHTGHGSFSKLRQFRLPYFASVYSAANEYKHCLEGTCDGLVCPVQESQYNCTIRNQV